MTVYSCGGLPDFFSVAPAEQIQCTATGRQQASNDPKPAQIHGSFEAAAEKRGMIRSEALNVMVSGRPQDVLMRY